jgi:hypothetical protein
MKFPADAKEVHIKQPIIFPAYQRLINVYTMKDSLVFPLRRLYWLMLWLYPTVLTAQTNVNQVLDEKIATVQLYPKANFLNPPIMDLKTAMGALVLEFDHLSEEVRDYTYTIVHCNSDWKPSDLTENEYIDGFIEDRITSFEPSFGTLTPYMHYTLTLPNQSMRWTKSGNYLLKVFDNTDEEKVLVMVRRFFVVEPEWGISANLTRTAQVSKSDTHHEIDFTVGFKQRVSNPQNVIGPVRPLFSRGDQLSFDYQDKFVFPAGKDWRMFDMRLLNVRGENVKLIEQRPNYYEVTLKPDKSRAGFGAVYRGDINGRFAIENQHFNQTVLQCDYAMVLFSITQNLPLEEEDVYVFGEITDWQIKPEFKMEYNDEARAYILETLLKQGLYNYEYRVVNRNTGVVDEEGLEGNWFETPNFYHVFVYYRPMGSRFERLVGTTTVRSGRN